MRQKKKRKKKKIVLVVLTSMSAVENFTMKDWEPLPAATVVDYRRVFSDRSLRDREVGQLKRRLEHVRANSKLLCHCRRIGDHPSYPQLFT